MGAPVIVTRPAAPGQRLAAALRHRGCDVAWWPAFDILPPADEAAVRRALDRLADYDLALFVSPERGPRDGGTTARESGRPAPSSVRSARVHAMRRSPNCRARRTPPVVAPDDADESGSEGFWRAWRASGRGARRVLLLRAATGRDWIVDQLRAADAEVDALAVYDRCPHRLPRGSAPVCAPGCSGAAPRPSSSAARKPWARSSSRCAASKAPSHGCRRDGRSRPIRVLRNGCRPRDS